ncbi:MAG: hypothetical protein AB1644_13610 [Candidatus Zixiibacteriota bacterium]
MTFRRKHFTDHSVELADGVAKEYPASRLLWVVLLTTGLALGLQPAPVRGSDKLIPRIKYSLEPNTPLRAAGPATLVFSFIPAVHGCDSVQVTVTTDGNLECHSPKQWTVVFGAKPPYTPDTSLLEVVIGDKDTCGFTIHLDCPRFDWDIDRFFVTTGDTIEIFSGDPRWIDRDFPQVPNYPQPPQGRRVRGEFPLLDSLFPFEDDTVTVPKQTLRRSESKAEDERLEMRRLELTPLANASVQTIMVDGQYYQRRKGEYKFHPIEVITDMRAHSQRRLDSVMAADAGRLHDTWLDLRDSAKYEWARKNVDSLIPTTVPGIFHALITKQTMNKLGEKDIEMHQWMVNLPGKRKLGEPEQQPSDTVDLPRGGGRVRPSSPQSSLFYESFDD